MGAPLRESDGSKLPKNNPSKEALREVGAAPSSKTRQGPEPPWKRKTRHGVFEGDIAAVELRSQLAFAPDRIPEPAAPVSNISRVGAVLRLTGIILMSAVCAGAAGYLLGFRLSTEPSQPAVAADQARSPPTRSAAPTEASNFGSEPLGAQTAAILAAPADAPAAATGAAPAAPQRSEPLPTSARTALPSTVSRRPEDASEIAVKMKIGADLMANGDIAAARMMFQRAAEAGAAAAAFALAETYDPAVLGKLRLRGGIAPDLALARSWYERARDLGSTAAADRIVRLTELPQ